MKYNGDTILVYRIEYPQFQSRFYQCSFAVLNKFYKEKALEYQKYYTNDLFDMAVEQYKFNVENQFPQRPYGAYVSYELAYNRACIISLYFDQYAYMGGAHGNTIRSSQTFNLQKNMEIKLSQLFPCSVDYKAYILREVKEEIEKDSSIYFDNYEELIVETFNENSFYCTPEGIVVYYQQYDIAPYSSGIREFLIPYNHCAINPIKMCFCV